MNDKKTKFWKEMVSDLILAGGFLKDSDDREAFSFPNVYTEWVNFAESVIETLIIKTVTR